ncbi:hypothetical protein LBMAG56_49680 [Verrucomicrobiota bacterium]|nr:hypothetical protein LBMAG56_49680 [Verrucomicrobiota bacterium]
MHDSDKTANGQDGSVAQRDPILDLEFPDWSGMKPRLVSVPFWKAVAENEELNRWFPAPPEAHRLRLERKIDVPFEL